MGKEAGKRRFGNRWIWIAAGIGVVIIAAVLLANRLISSRNQTQSQPETEQAFIGNMSGSITGSGHLRPQQDVSLSMATNGIVKVVDAKVGDTVKADEVLVRLDDIDARQAVTKAELQVASARLDVESAQNALASRVNWAPNQKQVAAAAAEVANAEASLKQAQGAYDRVSWLPNISSNPASLNLEQATNSYNVAPNRSDSPMRPRMRNA